MKAPKIGMWYSFCCWEDLYQIKNDGDVRELKEYLIDCIENDDSSHLMLWETKKEAITDLSQDASEENLARIEELRG